MIGRVLLILLLLAPATGCDFSIVEGSGGGAGRGISITITPTTATVTPGRSVALSARVYGTADSGVLWSVQSGPGMVYADGLYSAPVQIATDPTVVTVRARAAADTSVSATATITITNDTTGGGQKVSVTVTPSALNMETGGVQQFAATVTGSTNTGVTWSVVTGPGQISPTGRYLAPMQMSGTSATVTIQARSAADPDAIGRAVITLTPAPGSNLVCFERDILPLMRSSCGSRDCHGPPKFEKSYDFTNYAGILRGLKKGRPDDSEIYKSVIEDEASERMPKDAPAWSQQQIDLLRRWIEEGADSTKCPTPADRCDTTAVTYDSTVAGLVGPACSGCHLVATPYNGYISLNSYSEVRAVALSGKLIASVTHPDPIKRMPQGGSLDDCSILQLKKWVDLGAPER